MRRAEFYLGIDWGAKKCGIALADEENKIATPFKEIETNLLMPEIDIIADGHPLKKVVLGFNKEEKYSDNLVAIERLKRKLEDKNLEVFLESEAFTTEMAQQNLIQSGKKGVSKQDNAEAARIILQSWLDNY